MNIFKCTECGRIMSGFIPSKCECGYNVSVIDGVYQFTNDNPICVDESADLKWLGYENVGENYELGLKKNDGGFGMFGACSRKLSQIMEKNKEEKIALDLGAGLGQAAIPLAIAGVKTIAADISQTMMRIAAKRAAENNVPNDKIICARMNAYKLELEDKCIDAVIEIDMLHQVNKPRLVVDEIKRVLKSGGIYVKYASKSCGYTPEQEAENKNYNEILQDIKDFYANIISETKIKYDEMQIKNIEPPFSSWEAASDCIKENFSDPAIVDTDEIQRIDDWNIESGLYKLKTKASGSSQLIPDDIHNNVWRRTDEYAKNKYGENYNNIKRYYNFLGYLEVYKVK